MIIITERPLRLAQPHLTLAFAPYQEKQLVNILNKLSQQRLRQYREHVCDEEWLQTVLCSALSDIEETESTVLDEVRSQLFTPLMDRVCEALSVNYNGVITTALAGFLSTTTHPVVLLEASRACWSVLYGNTPEEVLSSVVTSYLEETQDVYIEMNSSSTGSDVFQSPSRRSRSSSAQNTPVSARKYSIDTAVLDTVLGHYLPGATAAQVRSAVKLMQHLPTYSYSTAEVVKLARKAGVEVKRPALASSTISTHVVVKQATELDKIDTTWSKLICGSLQISGDYFSFAFKLPNGIFFVHHILICFVVIILFVFSSLFLRTVRHPQ